jgi:hypothetical protein
VLQLLHKLILQAGQNRAATHALSGTGTLGKKREETAQLEDEEEEDEEEKEDLTVKVEGEGGREGEGEKEEEVVVRRWKAPSPMAPPSPMSAMGGLTAPGSPKPSGESMHAGIHVNMRPREGEEECAWADGCGVCGSAVVRERVGGGGR